MEKRERIKWVEILANLLKIFKCFNRTTGTLMKRENGIVILMAVILLVAFSSAIPLGAAEAANVEVIVGFAGQPDAELIRQYGGEARYVYSIISAIYASLPESAIEPLRKNPKITYIDKNDKVEDLGQTVPWGIDRVKAPQAWVQSTGNGVKIAILDTGIGPHQDIPVYGGYDFVNNDTDPSDDNGHGTHVAGTAAALFNSFGVVGVAPQANIYSVKIMDRNGTGYINWTIQGIQWAVNNGMQIISMSWNASNSPSLRNALDAAYNRGLLLVAAAGNSNNEVAYPAAYDSVIAVAATKDDNTRYEFSGVGEAVELAAPGVDINSTWLGNGYEFMSGTSMATPHVSGVAALVWAKNPALTNFEVRDILQKTALDLDPNYEGRDRYYGFGLVDAAAAVSATPSTFKVDFSWSPSTVYAGGRVTFDASASFGNPSGYTEYTWDFGDGNNATLNTPTVTHTFAVNGSYDVNLTVSSAFGFRNSTVNRVTVLQDSVPPVTVDNYDGLLHTSVFTIILTAYDYESGVAETYYRINDVPTKRVSADGQPFITSESANNRLEYWSVDNAGNVESSNILTEIKLDKTAPVGSVIINGGDAYATSTSVTLTLSTDDATSGVFQVRYSNDGIWDDEPWEAFSVAKTWALTGEDGAKTVYYQIRDNAGLVSITYSDTITLDTVPPTGGITIAGGAAVTSSATVTLTLSAADATSGVAQMHFSNDNTDWTGWEPYSDSKTWTLTAGDGAKTVYVQFMDEAGLISAAYSDNIEEIPEATSPEETAPAGEEVTFPLWIFGVIVAVTVVAAVAVFFWLKRK